MPNKIIESLPHLAKGLLAESVAQKSPMAFSPWSLVHTLLLFMQTSTGKSVEEIADALHLDASSYSPEALKKLIKKVSSDEAVKTAANIFARNVVPTAEYKALMQDTFDAEIEPLVSASQVNDWCKEATKGMIKSLVDSIDGLDVMLISALYFKADWSKAFSPEATRDGEFTKLDGTKMTRPLMHLRKKFFATHTKEFKACVLPYEHTNVAAIIVLPEEEGTEALASVVDHLDTVLVEAVQGQECTVVLTLPRFKQESSIGLKGYLQKLGMKEMFSVCETKPTLGVDTVVDDVLQKCIVEVDEKGTTAAAVTGVMMRTLCMPIEETISICCNRPFLFILQDMVTRALLFVSLQG